MRDVNLCGGVLERGDLPTLLPPPCQRVATGPGGLPQILSLFACLGEGHEQCAAEPDVAPLPLYHRAEHPTRGAALCGDQVQPTAVSDAPRADVAHEGLDGSRGQRSLWMSAHCSLIWTHILCGI